VVNIHVIDSLGLGVSVDELSTSADEWRPGIQARAWGKIFRRTNNYFDKEKNMVVMVNQVRQAFGKMVSETPTGGRQVEHISSLSLHFKTSSWLFEDKNGNLSSDTTQNKTLHGDTMAAGIELQIKLVKSRLSDPLSSTRVRLKFGTGGQFDQEWSLVRAAIFHSLVKKSGSWYELPTGEKVQGENGIRLYMQENPEFAIAARNAMLGVR
jgi:RecA/RadA recombinase